MSDRDLFSDTFEEYRRGKAPLADRMRPATFDEFVGQEQLTGEDRAFRLSVDNDRLRSMILWGPPGTGKTTLGQIIADATGRKFIHLSAVSAGVADIKKVVKLARDRIKARETGTILFLDEIHRFNKAQQDALLHHVEDGTITLIGATTENPSFEVNAALLSRCKVELLRHLDEEALDRIVDRAMNDRERGLGKLGLQLDDEARTFLISLAMGDGRVLLNNLEMSAVLASSSSSPAVTVAHAEDASGRQALVYDKNGEEHFNLISALHKSLRGSDPQAALYYLARMLAAGEDPLYIVRRMSRFASEDIGCADPNALVLAAATVDTVHFLGMPEADTALGELAVYLATAPKSNKVYKAIKAASSEVKRSGHLPVPLKLRNAPTGLMKKIGYGKGYRYPHNEADAFVADEYLPDALAGSIYFDPSPFGFEKEIRKRMEYWDGKRKKKSES